MKKSKTVEVILTVALVVFFVNVLIFGMLVLDSKWDKDEVIVEITTSTEIVEVYSTENSKAKKDTQYVYVDLQEDENVTIHASCKGCGYDESITVEAPFAKMFVCECGDNYRDYIATIVSEVKN